MKIVAIPCIIAVPSIFIVAPKGTVNDEIFFFTCKLSSKLFSVIGIVALLLDVEKANSKACLIPFRKKTMFIPETYLTKGK